MLEYMDKVLWVEYAEKEMQLNFFLILLETH